MRCKSKRVAAMMMLLVMGMSQNTAASVIQQPEVVYYNQADYPGVTDKDYYTNSNHVPVWYKCSPRQKAIIEAPYHELTRGGHIFYVEIDGDATHNPQAISDIVDLIDKYNIGYGSVNHNRNRCMNCGYEDASENLQECPKCGSKNIDKLQRITGYLVGTTDRWNSAKLAELNDRVVHK